MWSSHHENASSRRSSNRANSDNKKYLDTKRSKSKQTSIKKGNSRSPSRTRNSASKQLVKSQKAVSFATSSHSPGRIANPERHLRSDCRMKNCITCEHKELMSPRQHHRFQKASKELLNNVISSSFDLSDDDTEDMDHELTAASASQLAIDTNNSGYDRDHSSRGLHYTNRNYSNNEDHIRRRRAGSATNQSNQRTYRARSTGGRSEDTDADIQLTLSDDESSPPLRVENFTVRRPEECRPPLTFKEHVNGLLAYLKEKSGCPHYILLPIYTIFLLIYLIINLPFRILRCLVTRAVGTGNDRIVNIRARIHRMFGTGVNTGTSGAGQDVVMTTTIRQPVLSWGMRPCAILLIPLIILAILFLLYGGKGKYRGRGDDGLRQLVSDIVDEKLGGRGSEEAYDGGDNSQISAMINQAIDIYHADRTGRSDYALESGGGAIIGTRCTKTYNAKPAVISIFGLPLFRVSRSPRTIIQPGTYPGECWAFAGSRGTVIIQLATTINITDVSVEHVSKSITAYDNIDSAPRDFAIKGLRSEYDEKSVLLGNFTYEDNSRSLQYFRVPDNEAFKIVAFEVYNNHGHPDYTCVYRFRVHGIPYVSR